MKYIYSAMFTPNEGGTKYYARVPDLPGCITTGHDLKDAIDQITDEIIHREAFDLVYELLIKNFEAW